MFRMLVRPAAAVALAVATLPAAAQDLPQQGIGFAQAEEGTWLCRHEDPFEALSCAQEFCAEQSGGQECVPTTWCYPARWSGLMTVWLEDFHTTEVLCGISSEAALRQAMEALCAANEFALTCDLFLTVDPRGLERQIEGVTFAGGAGPPQPDSITPADMSMGDEAPAPVVP